MATFTEQQFALLLEKLSPAQNHVRGNGSFSKCSARFRGQRDPNKVEEFITTVSLYKEVEAISDEEAVNGLPLLLEDFAATWWCGIKEEATSWKQALKLIRDAFAPPKPAYRVYLEMFDDRQTDSEPTDSFICRQRARLAQLPKPHTEEVMVDLIYGLLSLEIRKRIPRDSVTTFHELLVKARHVELVHLEAKQLNGHHALKVNGNNGETGATKKERCSFCRKGGHNVTECRKRKQQGLRNTIPERIHETAPSTSQNVPKQISCYGCGSPGFYRANCPTCKGKPKPGPANIAFNSFNTVMGNDIPTITITAHGETGVAYLDTAARTSIAGYNLFMHLMRNGASFERTSANVVLADGSTQERDLYMANVDIIVGHRLRKIRFAAFPESRTNKTLIGIDFLEENGIVMNLAQRCWYYIDEPERTFDFYDTRDSRVNPKRNPATPKKPMGNSTFLALIENLKTAEDNKKIDPYATENYLGPPLPRSETPPTFAYEQQNDYSFEAIQAIFEGSIRTEDIVEPPPEERKRRQRKHPDQQRQAKKSQMLEFMSVDIILRENEAIGLTSDQKAAVNALLEEEKNVFEPIIEPTPYAEHVINTQDNAPIATSPYRLSPIRKSQLHKEIAQMKELKIIEECESPWAAPVVLVPKKDGGVRVCVDYRQLNSITVSDRYPLPRIDDLLHGTKKTLYKSTLDLQSGYWQIKVADCDQEKTAFVTPFGMYKFLRMPFGLKNAPATFQRLMDKFKLPLSDIIILVYLDDVIICSPTFEEHLEDLRRVIKRLQEFKLKANREKSNFFCSRIKYLGHVITSEGIQVDPDKTAAIVERPNPKNAKEVLSFLQTCSWYRRFIPGFAQMSKPLSDLTKKNAVWKWDEETQQSYDKLKELLTTAPILQQAQDDKPFYLKTDASGYAIGAVLVQGEGKDEHPIEYASRLLNDAERNYSTTEREALAIVWAISKFRGYIDGAEVTLLTDHQPLKWLMTLKSPTGRLARWALALQPHNVKIKYIPGRINNVADTLSRPPCQNENHTKEVCPICTVQINLPAKSNVEIRNEQRQDPELGKIIDSFQKDDENVAYWTRKGYMMNEGILYRYSPDEDEENAQLVIPVHKRPEILKQYHDNATAGHYGVEKTITRIASRYYWPGMRKEITEYVKNCVECQKYKPSNLKPAGLMKTLAINQRFETVAIDLFGPLPKSLENYQWILIVEDVSTRWVELFPLTEATAERCATILLEEIFLRYGMPRSLITDNGTQFISAIMQQLTHILGIQQVFTPLYHPEANPVERKNRDLKTQLAIHVKDDHTSWPEHLSAVRFAMNTAKCQSTGHSAAYLTFGRELRTLDDIQHDVKEVLQNENFHSEIVPRLTRLIEIMKDVQETTDAMQNKNKQYVDKKRSCQPTYKIGDQVLVTTHILSKASKNITAKFVPKRDGPYVIIKKVGSSSYQIAHADNVETPLGTYHASSLKPYRATKQDIQPVCPLRRRGRPRRAQD